MSTLLPSDVDEAIADRYQMEAMLNHTAKPLIFVTYEFGAVEMMLIFSCSFFSLLRVQHIARQIYTIQCIPNQALDL